MPDNISEKIADKYVSHTVDLSRFEIDVRNKALNFLNLLEIETIEQIKKIDPTGVLSQSAQIRRLNALILTVNQITTPAYTGSKTVTEANLRKLVPVEGQFVVKTINSSVGVDIASVKFTPELINTIVSDTLIEGAPSRTWWARQSVNYRNKFADEMRLGVGLGEDINTLSRRVRGTATGQRRTVVLPNGDKKRVSVFKGGFMDTTRRQADALVRTSVETIANESRLQTYQQNADIIEGVQALVTLDTRTSAICIARSGAVWGLDGKPISGTTESFPGPPAWHWQCRSTLIPILKDFNKLTREVNKTKKGQLESLSKSTQSSINGQVAEDLTYQQWLRTQSKSKQIDVLGPGKFKLWNEGKLNLTQLINQDGRPLTLTEIEARI